jgi:NodT family efflux transporter outer membrane factor (OMF) lipoprotein
MSHVVSSLSPVLRRRTPAALIGALLCLGACAVGPDYQQPDVTNLTPVAHTTTDPSLSTGPAVDRWWTTLGDPVLDALVDHALASNPDLASAEARVQQARALARVAGAAFYPSVNASARVSRDKLSLHSESLALIPFTPPTTEFTDYRIGFDASWEIDLAGRTRRDVEAAVARLDSATEGRNDARLVVAAEVADAYVSYRTAAERLAIAKRTLADLDETARLVGLQVRAGVASDGDLGRAEADRLSAAGVLPTLEAARHSAALQLAALTGEPEEAIQRRLDPPRPIPSVPSVTPVGLPADVLRRRPDVRRAERELAAATADVGVAVAAQFPRLTLVGDFGWDSVYPGELASAASRYWNLAPQLTVPLFAGGRLRGQADAARAAQEAILGTYRATVLRALADAETALVRFAGERNRATSLEAAAARLEGSASLERRRFESGDASMIDVLAAQRLADQSADQRAASAGQLAQNYIALGKALGGGWQMSGD